MNLPYKLVVTGSGSLELKANVIESMTGRKRLFYIYPLTFTEFVAHQTKINFSQVSQFCQLHPILANRLFNDYLTFGGYPRVVLASSLQEKIAHLQEIYTSYIEKDIRLLLDIDRDQVYQNLVIYLAAHTGSLINRAEIARNFSTTEKTLKKYLYLLEKTFIITLVKPFLNNPTKELTKSPIAYFHDLGLRNLGLTPIPIEAKAKILKPGIIGKSLISFINQYRPPTAYLYHLGAPSFVKKSTTLVTHLPFYQLPHFSPSPNINTIG